MLNKFKNTNLNELLKGSSISFVLKLVGMLFGYLTMLFVTNTYGAEVWGIHSLCFTLLGIVTLVPKFGFDNALIRIITELKLSNNKTEIVNVLKKSITLVTIISLLVFVVFIFFSNGLIEHFIKKPEIKPFIKIICFAILPYTILTIFSSYFQALKEVGKFILFQTTLINIVFFVLTITLSFTHFHLPIFSIYVLSICTAFFAALLLFFKSIKKLKHSQSTDQKDIYDYKKILNISFPMLLSSSFALLMGWSDIIILSIYNTTADIGIYDSALKLSALSGIFLIAINAIATPKFVEFYSNKNLALLEDTVKNSTKIIFFTTTPLLLVLMVFSKQILGLFGVQFVSGYVALIILCFSRFINAIAGSVGYIMQMTDQQKTYQKVILVAFVINVILNFILIPYYGIIGAAIASSVATIFWNITLVLIIKRNLGFWTFITLKK